MGGGWGGGYLHDLLSHKKTPCQVCHSVVRADPQVGVGDIYRIVGRVGVGVADTE